MIEFHQFQRQYKNTCTYILLIIGILTIVLGVSTYFLEEYLIKLGDSYARDGTCCTCRIYLDFIKAPLIIIGIFLSFISLFQKNIIKVYDTYLLNQKALLMMIMVLIFTTLAIIAYNIFENFPYSMDEYCYLYQAKIFSRGKLFIHVDETYKPFIEQYMILKNNKLFSQYPPGFPLILAIGVMFNVAGLTNPLISVLTLLILYLFVKSFLGGKYALLSIILMSTTPYFLAYSASYYSQSTALFMTVLIVFSLRKYELTSKSIYLILLGLFSGYSLLTRPLDSFCVVIPSYIFLIFIIHKKNDWRNFFYSVSLFIMLFAVFLTYNYILGDKISLGLFPVVTSSFRIVDPAAQGLVQNVVNIANDYYHNGVKFIPMFLGKYLLIPSGLFILLLGIVGIWKFKSKWKWLLIANFLMLIFFYNFHRGFSWPSYGARYYYSGFGSLVVLGTFGFKKVVEVLESRSVVLFLLSLILCTNMVFGTILFHKYSDRFKIKLGILENIASQCFSSDIVILDPKGKKPGRRTCRRKVEDWEIDLGSEKRNMFMNGPRLLIDIRDKDLDLEEILGDFPNNSVCVYKYDNLNELRCYDN